MKQGQSSAEFILVILFFLIVITTILVSYYRLIPSEAEKIQMQRACSRAEILYTNLLNDVGLDTNWHAGGDLSRLGLSTGNITEIDYNKWHEAKELGIFSIMNTTNQTEPFYLEYAVYALSTAQRDLASDEGGPFVLPNETSARVNIMRGPSELKIFVGSDKANITAKLKFFFPNNQSSIIIGGCGLNMAAELPYDTNSTTYQDGGGLVTLEFTTQEGPVNDLDCITMNMPTPIFFLRKMQVNGVVLDTGGNFAIETLGTEYPVYVGNHTIAKSSFGMSIVDPAKTYCSLERAASLRNNVTIPTPDRGTVYPIKLKVIST